MRYHNITKDDMLNGDGLRVVLWVAGCSHYCEGCQNKITWDPNGGLPFDNDAINELYKELEKDYISGITFSGGDPLYENNIIEITNLSKEIKARFPKKTIWLYTGDIWEDICGYEIFNYIDVLVDGPFVLNKRDVKLQWKGSSNQRVIDVKKSKEIGKVVLY